MNESIDHLFFNCSLAKYTWSLMAVVIGTACRPTSFDQFWEWVNKFMPIEKKIHMVGLAAVCWALRKRPECSLL
jgi:hypothetical protein